MSIPVQTFIDHINDSIEKANRHQSWIHADALNVRGFTTGVMIRLFSNIVHLPISEPAYLEVGLYGGKSFCACMNNSPTLHLYGIEDFSQPFDIPTIREELEANIEKFKGGAKSVTVINSDCFKVDPKQIKYPVQVYLYDGCHDYEFQQKALPHFIEAMDDTFVFMVDDFSWSSVSTGTFDGIKELGDKIKVERQWILKGDKAQDDEKFHNGLGIFLISKVK